MGAGFVESLGHPGGNITGITNISRELAAKRLQVLKEIIPKASRVAVLVTDESQVEPQLEQVQQAAKRLGNMKVANALGLKIPEPILLQATKVIR